MKNLFQAIFIIIISHTIESGFGSQTQTQAQNSYSSQIFASSSLSEKNKEAFNNLTDTTVSNPLLGVISEKNLLHQGIQSRKIKAAVPAKVVPLLQKSKLSIFKVSADQFKNYPPGAALFPNYGDLASKFDLMIHSFIAEPDFVPLFRKIHMNVLNELYHYLIGIFMNFNLQHQGMIQNAQGEIISSVPKYLQTEQEYDINKKTMIINHLMAIIESQFNGAVQSYVPYIPQSFATYVGRTAIQNDYSTDLTHLIIEQIEPELKQLKTSSLQALANYVSFFTAMTNYLDKKTPKVSMHFNSFIDIAETINQFLYANKANNQILIEQMKAKSPSAYLKADTAGAQAITEGKASAKAWVKGMPYAKESSPSPTKNSHIIHNDAQLIALAKMNPPIFHFGYDDIRALKLIPYLAKKISPKSKKIPWPDHLIEAANKLILLKADDGLHPIAYFKTKHNTMVKNINGNAAESDLYLCMRLGYNLFEQILIQEPDWLSSWDGILKILRACYGDFTTILGMGILDPVTEAVINNVVKVQNGQDPDSADSITQKAISLINSWKEPNKKVEQKTDQSLPSLGLPALPSLTTPPPLDRSLMTPSLISQP